MATLRHKSLGTSESWRAANIGLVWLDKVLLAKGICVFTAQAQTGLEPLLTVAWDNVVTLH